MAGPPKLGKTTFAYEAATHIAMGESFLGRDVSQGKVLVLGLEEHRSDIVARFRENNGEDLEGCLKIQFPPLPFEASILKELAEYIEREGIRLVLLDTLHAWWGINDENDAAEVLQKGMPFLRCVRSTKAAWLSIVHTRKASGQHGDEIRGSTALVGFVDICVSMKRTEGPKGQRVLQSVTRYKDTPPELIVEYRDGEYVAVGDSHTVLAETKAELVFAALTHEGQCVDPLTTKTGLSKQEISNAMKRLGERVRREGKGVKGDPFRYSLNAIHPTPNPKEEQLDESNVPAPGYTRSVDELFAQLEGLPAKVAVPAVNSISD